MGGREIQLCVELTCLEGGVVAQEPEGVLSCLGLLLHQLPPCLPQTFGVILDAGHPGLEGAGNKTIIIPGPPF